MFVVLSESSVEMFRPFSGPEWTLCCMNGQRGGPLLDIDVNVGVVCVCVFVSLCIGVFVNVCVCMIVSMRVCVCL